MLFKCSILLRGILVCCSYDFGMLLYVEVQICFCNDFGNYVHMSINHVYNYFVKEMM